MEVLSDAVDSMIEKLDRQSPVLYWLLEYIEERIADDKRWNVSGEIKNFGRNIFDEGYIEKGNGLREKLRDKDCIKKYRETLQAILEAVSYTHLDVYKRQSSMLPKRKNLCLLEKQGKESIFVCYTYLFYQSLFIKKQYN